MKKKILLSLIFALSMATILGQSPNAFKYQAVIRDTSGIPISDKDISLRISILKGDINGEEVYQESHIVQSDKLGLVNLNIGQGVEASSDFADIPWGEDAYFINIEIDMNGGVDYHLLGVSQLLAVPYALYAEHAGNNIWVKCDSGIYYNEGKVGIGTHPQTGMLVVEHPAQWPRGEMQEVIFEGKVSDAPYDFIKMYNGTDNNGQFIPGIWGHHQSDKRMAFGMIGTINSDMDYGTEPVTIFASRVYNGEWNWEDVQTRPLFSWRKLYEDKMTMLANGFLGLGTTKPNTLFHIEGNSVNKNGRELLTVKNNSNDEESSAIVKIMSGEDSTSTILLHTAESYEWQGRSQMGMLGNNGKGLVVAATGEDGEIRFETGGAGIEKERMRIAKAGQILIGATDPDHFKLKVETIADGGGERAIAMFKNNSTASNSLCNIYVSAGDGSSSTVLNHCSPNYSSWGGRYKSHSLLQNSGKGLVLRTGQNDQGRFAFEFKREIPGSYTYDEKVSITYEGNLGIGTTTPQRKLHVNDVMRLEPRYSAPENPAEGDMYMDGNDHVLMVFDGTQWRSCW